LRAHADESDPGGSGRGRARRSRGAVPVLFHRGHRRTTLGTAQDDRRYRPHRDHRVRRRGATLFAISDHDSITTCSAEDLIVHKAFAGRDKDWGDIRGIVTRQSHLDRRLIWDELLPLLELRDDTETEAKLRRLLSPKP
jgi:hypothetical protein